MAQSQRASTDQRLPLKHWALPLDYLFAKPKFNKENTDSVIADHHCLILTEVNISFFL